MLTYVLTRAASMGDRRLVTPFVTDPITLITPSINHPIYRTFLVSAPVLFRTCPFYFALRHLVLAFLGLLLCCASVNIVFACPTPT